MKRLVILAVLLLLAISTAAQQATFTDVKVRFVKSDKREMDEKGADLMLDQAARRLRVKSGDRPLDISFDDVQKVVVEVDTLGRKANFGASFVGLAAGGFLFGNTIATSIDKPFDNDHFVYLEYKQPNGSIAPYGMTIAKQSVPQALKALQTAFGDRVQVPVFDEKSEKMEKAQLVSGRTAIAGPDSIPVLVGDKQQIIPAKAHLRYINTDKQHPLPELRPDKALVVVATPATIMKRIGPEKHYGVTILHANYVLVAVNGPGCYTFFYLDPGEYFLDGQNYDIVGLRLKLEAGKDYYFTQTLYAKSILLRTFLTRHSKELVMYEVAGSLWSDWGLEESKKK
ncbi:MAG: hypothetical protein LAN63_05860 [Acidobacteriia bacterium]|nr:hypothetical protein [Terriglobia bacterium]